MSGLVINPYSFAAPEAPPGGANGTQFNGTTQYLIHSDPTGWADSKLATGSLWVKRDGASGRDTIFSINGGTVFRLDFLATTNKFFMGTTGSPLSATSGTAISDTTTWHHILFSFDLSDTGKRHLYIDDVLDSTTWTTYTDATLDFEVLASANYMVGARSGGDYFQGDLSEFWFNPGTYIDFSVEANRRKFRTAGGLPAGLGSDGSLPTGASPEVYLADGRTQTGTTSAFTPTNGPTAVDGPNP